MKFKLVICYTTNLPGQQKLVLAIIAYSIFNKSLHFIAITLP